MSFLRVRLPNGKIVEVSSLPGYTPQKGVDYFTEEEIAGIVAEANAYTDEKTAPATYETYGTVKVADDRDMASISNGIYTDESYGGRLSILPATEDQIDGGYGVGTVITPLNLEYAVKSVGDGYYATEEQVGDIEAALDSILAIQESLIGGDSV